MSASTPATKQPAMVLEINSEANKTLHEFEFDADGDLLVTYEDQVGLETMAFWIRKEDVEHLRGWLNRHALSSETGLREAVIEECRQEVKDIPAAEYRIRALKNAAPQKAPSAGNHSGEDLPSAVSASPSAIEQGTPRVDADPFVTHFRHSGTEAKFIELARQLERELAEAKGEIHEWRSGKLCPPGFVLVEESAPSSIEPSDVPADATAISEIEEFRREHLITAHVGETSNAGLEPWAIQHNRILNYLCYRACTPLSATTVSDEELREIAKKHARQACRPHPHTTPHALDAISGQEEFRAQEIIFYALKEAMSFSSTRSKNG